ncbi:hypothetical protein HY498_04740 [Candidatus Woesearchaeota archaeon]|nr:hypothetical protein [Candidatus Woesearchaeota archaeon]
MINLKGDVYQFVLTNGPIIPVQAAKNFKIDIMMTSAYLSELVAEKKLYVTKFLKIGTSPLYYAQGQETKLKDFYSHLPQRPRQITEVLETNKILRDIALEPWQRVALRETIDFAVPIKVITDKEEIFWRWYLLPQEEAENIIKAFLNPQEKLEKPLESQNIQTTLEIKDKIKVGRKKTTTSDFEKEILEYLNKKELKILNSKIIRKGVDIEYDSEMNSNIGKINICIKAKNKKKINESDLGLVLNLTNEKKTPVLFLTNGILVKKAEKYLQQNKGLIIFRNIHDKKDIL